MNLPQTDALEEVEFTPAPFYVHGVFNRSCQGGSCDFCMFDSDENTQEEGGCCPSNLWYYVTQREKVIQKFDASHPPICPECGTLMVADRTITRGDKDVAAFTCNNCHKLNRDSRASVKEYNFYKARGCFR